jgi:hypothetical protein
MNIAIYWKIKNKKKPITVGVKIFNSKDYIYNTKLTIKSESMTNFEIPDFKQNSTYTFSVSRQEILKSNSCTLDAWLVIDKVIIDDFWELSEQNFPSYSYYNNEYYNAVKINGATWELEKYRFNNVLFFNGKIEFSITTPVRTMFWH